MFFGYLIPPRSLGKEFSVAVLKDEISSLLLFIVIIKDITSSVTIMKSYRANSIHKTWYVDANTGFSFFLPLERQYHFDTPSEDAVSCGKSSTTYGMSAPLSDRHVLQQYPSQAAKLYHSSQLCVCVYIYISWLIPCHSAILSLKQPKPLKVIANFSYFLPSYSSTSQVWLFLPLLNLLCLSFSFSFAPAWSKIITASFTVY